jgi:hypothetical protein
VLTPFYFGKKNNTYIFNSKVAKAYYGIPVPSALVERFFSKTGFILRPHRRCMQDDLAESSFIPKKISIFELIEFFFTLNSCFKFSHFRVKTLNKEQSVVKRTVRNSDYKYLINFPLSQLNKVKNY